MDFSIYSKMPKFWKTMQNFDYLIFDLDVMIWLLFFFYLFGFDGTWWQLYLFYLFCCSTFSNFSFMIFENLDLGAFCGPLLVIIALVAQPLCRSVFSPSSGDWTTVSYVFWSEAIPAASCFCSLIFGRIRVRDFFHWNRVAETSNLFVFLRL